MMLFFLTCFVLIVLAFGFRLVIWHMPVCDNCPVELRGTSRFVCDYPLCSGRPSWRWVHVRTWSGSYVELDRAHLALAGWARYAWRKLTGNEPRF